MFKKVIGVLAIFVLVALAGYTWLTFANSAACNNSSESSSGDAPTVSEAPYLVQTNSRAYYALDVAESLNAVTLSGYYEVVKGKWLFRPTLLVLSRAVYGKITVIKR